MKTFNEFNKENDMKKKQHDSARNAEDQSAGDAAKANTVFIKSTIDQVAITKEPIQ